MSLRRSLDYLIAGFLWGALAIFLVGRSFGGSSWTGFFLSPLVGLTVGSILQRPFESRNGPGRSVISLLSLYLGGTLFAIAIAAAQTARFERAPLESAGEAVLGVWWGITLTGFLLFLWPLAYFTHWVLEWRADR